MFVDTLLKMIGDDPAAYVSESDKWIHFENYILMFYVFPYLPWVLAAVPWIYFLIQRKKHTKDSRNFLKKIIIYSVGGFILGYVIPWLFVAILASLAAYSLY